VDTDYIGMTQARATAWNPDAYEIARSERSGQSESQEIKIIVMASREKPRFALRYGAHSLVERNMAREQLLIGREEMRTAPFGHRPSIPFQFMKSIPNSSLAS